MPSKSLAIQTALAGDWQNATSINKALLSDNPNDIEALNRLAFAFSILGKIKESKATYKKVLELDSLNPIALRNMKRLADSKNSDKISKTQAVTYVHNTFLEETGKTKIIELVNLAQPRITSSLRVGQPLIISIKRLKIFIQDLEKQYLGVLPDDIGKKLIRFIKGGNQYETYVRSANNHAVVVFVKEIKQATRFKNQPSFLQNNDKTSIFEKEKEGHKKTYSAQESEES